MSAPLNKELKTKYGVRMFQLVDARPAWKCLGAVLTYLCACRCGQCRCERTTRYKLSVAPSRCAASLYILSTAFSACELAMQRLAGAVRLTG
jgi:hypothetical protein